MTYITTLSSTLPIKVNKILVVEKVTRFVYLQRKNELEKLAKNKYQTILDNDSEHSAVRKLITQTLDELGFEYELVAERGLNNLPDLNYDLVITLGGDGTFLNVAKKLESQFILGVNSEPGQSVGFVTRFNSSNLVGILNKIKAGLVEIEKWNRLSVSINGIKLPFLALNEILIGKLNIFQTSKLQIDLPQKQGYCLGNGIIVSTKMGSTAFYKSAGGMPFEAPNYGYTMILPYQLGGDIQKNVILASSDHIKITPKRDDHYVIFDCDDSRKILLNDEDEVEVEQLDNNKLHVIVN